MAQLKVVRNVAEAVAAMTLEDNLDPGTIALVVRVRTKNLNVEFVGQRFKSPKSPDVQLNAKEVGPFVTRLVHEHRPFISSNGDGLIHWKVQKESPTLFGGDHSWGTDGNEDEEQGRDFQEEKPGALSEKKAPENIPKKETPKALPKAERARREKKEIRTAEVQKIKEDLEQAGMMIGFELVRVSKIRPFVGQPRDHFNMESLERLAKSLAKGQRQPAIAMKINDPEDLEHEYELVEGERRLKAAKLAKKEFLGVVIVAKMNKKQQFLYSAVANFGREDHTPLEEARAIARIKEENGLTDAQVGELFARSIAWVCQRTALLKLNPEVLEMMNPDRKEKQLSFSIAYSLATNIKDQDRQLKLAKEILEKNIRLNQARQLIRRSSRRSGFRNKNRPPSEDLRNLRRFLDRTYRDTEIFLPVLMDDEVFEEMFKKGGLDLMDAMKKKIENVIQRLKLINDRILVVE
jgi:ParB family transcriptional regulator, chromosome partitioning protein